MKDFPKAAKGLALAALLASAPAFLFAGNIRQYSFSKSTKDGYEPLTDATEIVPDKWTNQTVIFGDMTSKLDAYTGQGFPIGFDFHFGGQDFDQFAVTPGGTVLLGFSEVKYGGRGGSFFVGEQEGYDQGFYLGMTPVSYGVRSGNISYKTEGEEGNRVLTIQFANMILNETEVGVALSRCGKYSVQVRLYEDGRIQYAFLEQATPTNNAGFYTGLRGWDDEDCMLLTSTGLNNKVELSTERTGSMLTAGSYVKWDPEDPDNEYAPVFTFTPESSQTPVNAAPTNLQIVQNGKNIEVSCDRAENAPATMILMSNKPITNNDLPDNGVTYGVHNSLGDFIGDIGDATVIYYSDDEHPVSVIRDVPEQTPMYVRAISVNGYPVYDTDVYAEASLVASQNPPTNFEAVTEGDVTTLSWTSKYPVIIATTQEYKGAGVYQGVFGQPESTAKAGDLIEGGGEVIYAGDASEFAYTMDDPNTLYLFRIWNVDTSVEGGLVSSTGTDTEAVPAPTYPYEPKVENYPCNVDPLGWGSSSDNYGFRAALRDGDNERAFRGYAVNQEATYAITPALPAGKNAKLTFEYGIETMRDPEKDPETGIEMLKGYEPGWYGEAPGAGFNICIGPNGNETVLKTITEYNGTMDIFAGTDYQQGSCTYDPVEIEIGEIPAGSRIGFSFLTEKSTAMFIRNIRLDAEVSGVQTTVAATPGLTVTTARGELTVLADADRKAEIYNAAGIHIASCDLKAGQSETIALPAGIYVVAGIKVIVR